MLTVITDNSFFNEKKYIFDIVLKEYLGIEYKIQLNENFKDNYLLRLNCGSVLSLNNVFFSSFRQESNIFHLRSLPENIVFFESELLAGETLPVIYGDASFRSTHERGAKKILCGIDIVASIFFMLTRWEEVVVTDRDVHNRFPGTASIAHKSGFLHRPIVNEYVEFLWNILLELGINQRKKKHQYKILLTHDVDNPYRYYSAPIKEMIHEAARMFFKDHDAINGLKQPFYYFLSKFCRQYDPYYTAFDYIMSVSERYGLQSLFYFICDCKHELDGRYSIGDKKIRFLMKDMLERGHYVGLHGSYTSYDFFDQYKYESSNLNSALAAIGFQAGYPESRQHFLRWDPMKTPDILEKLGVICDSSLSYPDVLGFRCGTCYEFPLFSLSQRKQLNVTERPLTLMEGTLFHYLNVKSYAQCLEIVKNLKKQVVQYQGDFVLLWHNSQLYNSKLRELYHSVVCCLLEEEAFLTTNS